MSNPSEQLPDPDTFFQEPQAATTPTEVLPDPKEFFHEDALNQEKQANQQDWISKLYHPAITGLAQGAGALAAGTLAAPGGPVASGLAGFAGGAAMYPPANRMANAIDEMRGIQPPSSTLGQDVVTGMEQEAGGRAMGAALGLAGKGLNAGFKKVVSAFLGPSTEALGARMENPDIMNAPSFSQLAYKLPKTLGLLKDKISDATEAASQLLRNSTDPSEGAIPVSQINQMVQGLQNDLQTSGVLVGPARQAAGKQLQSLVGDVNKIMAPVVPSTQIVDQTGKVIPWVPPDTMLPEQTIKDVLQAVRKNINWDDMGLTETNSALTKFSGQLDAMLKNNNPEYKAAMKPISDMMGNLDDTMSAFSLTKRTGEGIQPTDATISKLQSVVGDKKSVSQDILNELANFTGDDYLQQAKNYALARQFQGGVTQGSRKVSLGSMVGTPLGAGLGYVMGHPGAGAIAGEAVGGGLGALADKYGGQAAGAIVDKYALLKELASQLSQHLPMELANRIAFNAVLATHSQGGQ